MDGRLAIVPSSPAGSITICREIYDNSYIRSSETYQDYLVPRGYGYLLGSAIARDGTNAALLGIMRSEYWNIYKSAEIERFRLLARHVGRAIQLQWCLQGLERKLFVQAQALDVLSFGVVVCNGYGHVYHANLEAEQI